MSRTSLIIAAALVAAALAAVVQLNRAQLGVADVVAPAGAPAAPSITDAIAAAPAAARGERLDFLRPAALGEAIGPDDRPMIANVAIVDLDRDGLADVVVADATTNRVTWVRQSPKGRFTEQALADVAGPAHVHVADLDGDGDLDIAVASLGVLFPNNARIGAVILLENDGRQRFTPRLVADKLARVADVRSGDLDGDGDLDLAVALFGYDQGETRWFENLGGGRYESHLLQELSGVINAEIADIDGDGDLDIITLVSQEWEEIYVHVNDGHGRFTAQRIFGASNEDFGSSWISLGDLDGDGDLDVIYSNGDAFDYATTAGRSWNGLQWLENTGGVAFPYHRIADIAGGVEPAGRRPRRRRRSRHRGGQRLQQLGRAVGPEPGLARERRHGHLHAARRGQFTHAPGHARGWRSGRRRPPRSGHRRDAYELALRPPLASHRLDQHVAGAHPVAAWPWRAGLAVAAAATAAWLVTGFVTGRALGARMPPPADLAGVSAPVREAILDADAQARKAPSAATAGALGRVYHANLRVADALAAYAVAEGLAPAEWRWTYLRALIHEERGDQGPERAALERVTAAAPTFGPAWYRRGELAFKQRRLDDARADYERARDAPATAPFAPPGVTSRQTVPLGAYAGLGLARVALEQGDRQDAVQRLRTLVQSYPAFGPARTQLRALDGETAPGSGAFAAPYVPPADPVLDALVAESRHSDLLLKHAGIATRAGDAAWREFLVRRALSFNPRDLNVLMEMAAMLQATGRPAEALAVLKQHEALAPGDHNTLVEQGRVLGDLGRLGEAEAVLLRAVTVRDAAAEYNLGAVLDRQGRWADAQARYARALTINPFHARAMNNMAVGLDRNGQTAQAVPLFERAIEISPTSAEFYVNYGSALIQQRRFDDAVRVLTEAVGLDPRAPNGHNNLGIALAQRGDLGRAREAFAQALALDPGHVNARRNLERVNAVLGAR